MIGWIVDGTVVFVILYTLVSVAVLLFGVRFLELARAQRIICQLHMTKLVGTPLDTGMSVVVYGYGRLDSVESLLHLNYSLYEVVVVCDISKEVDAKEFVRRYGMFRYEYASTSELPCAGVRGVYRSRFKRYAKLVIVDKEQSGQADVFNCATEVARYDSIIYLDRYSTLVDDALNVFAAILSQYDSHYVYAVVALKVGVRPAGLFAKVCYYYTMMRDNICSGALFGMWRDSRVTALFNRESVLSVGGFTSAINFEQVMLRTIRETNHSVGRGFSFSSIYVGLPLVRTTSKRNPSAHTIIDALFVMGALMLFSSAALIIKHEWILVVYLILWQITEIVIALLALREFGVVEK